MVFVSNEDITYALPGSEKPEKKGWVIKEKLIHAKKTKALGRGETETKVNSFNGNDPAKWQRNISTFHSVYLGEVYKDIELELRAYGSNVEKVFTVGRGADPGKIRVEVQGADSLHVTDKGELEMKTGLGAVKMTAPVAYQEINGKTVQVMASYSMKGPKTNHEYGFTLGVYNKDHPVIIDPLLASTFIGGSDYDKVYSLSVDQSGNVYVVGTTLSSDYPATVGAYDESHNNGYYDVFVDRKSVV